MTWRGILVLKLCCLLLVLNATSGNATQRSEEDAQLCNDKDPECYRYADDFCQAYGSWSKTNCAAYCGFCQPVGIEKKMCSDRVDCGSYGCDVCKKKPSGWSDVNCPYYCKKYFCINRPPPGVTNRCVTAATAVPITRAPTTLTTTTQMPTPLIPTIRPTFPPTPVTPALPCKDQLTDCATYGGKVILCRNPDFQGWVKTNCQKYCGLCIVQPRTAAQVSITTESPTTPLLTTTKAPITIASTTPTTTTQMPTPLIPTIPPTLPPTPVTPALPCKDQITDCAAYGGKAICKHRDHQGWVKTNCRKYCGLCTVKTTVRNPAISQLPSITSSSSPQRPTTKSSTPPVPTLPPTPALPPCKDLLTDCAEFGMDTCNTPSYKSWAEKNCRKYCKLC